MKVGASARVRGRIERRLLEDGLVSAGVDEVGRGCLAGPVHAGCVVLDLDAVKRLPRPTRHLIRDSKQLSAEQRALVAPVIREVARAAHVAEASVREIEAIGIAPATFLAMRRAIAGCAAAPFDVLLVDGKIPVAGYDGTQLPIVKGDALCYAIAAASILAKEARDGWMREQAATFPVYGFDQHVGYSTAHHLAMIQKHGICDLHRRNFGPVRDALGLGEPAPFLG
jgi:ribonuclease HII